MIKRKKIGSTTKIVLGFLAVILIGTFFLCLPISAKDGQWFSFIDSLFTSTSAVCITGLLTVDVAVHFSLFGQIVLLILIQIGGLGFVTLACLAFMIIGKKITYEERKTIQESLNQDNVQGVVKLVRNIVILVFSVEFVGFVCFLPSMISLYGWGDGIFKSLFLSISAFCNMGVDTFGTVEHPFASLSGFSQNVAVLLPIMMLIIVGGIGFGVLFDFGGVFKKKKMSFHSKVTLIATGILILTGTVLFAILEWNNAKTLGGMSAGGKILNSLFMSVAPRTAGFSTVSYADMTTGSIVLTCILMFIGGGSVSAAGGIKVTTFVCLLVALFKPSNNGEYVFCKRRISNKLVQKCLKVTGIAILLIVVSTFLICAVEGSSVAFIEVVFEVISALSTVGLSFGITAGLSVFSKLILIALMFVGRVGALSLTLAMASKLSNGNQEIQYPDSKIVVG